MILPSFGAKENRKIQHRRFGGLDLRDKASTESLAYSQNLSADAYPAIVPRKARKQVVHAEGITAICAPEYTGEEISAFTGVKNQRFYYQGTLIDGVPLSEGEKSIADFNGKICIFPDKVYYDYLPDPDTGEVSQSLSAMEKSLTVSGVTFYSSYDELTGAYTAYLSKTDGGFDRFQTGESIVIDGCTKPQNNTCILQGNKDFAASDAIVSAVVESATAHRLELLLFTKQGGYASFENMKESGTITVRVSIPDMDHVCVHNNRLWGTAQNGEYLYASKLGDCFNFFSFQGLSEDSWYGRIGTPGGFTGICSYRSAVVAFKRNYIHHVYGDAPKNFSIPKQTVGGCIDGRSIAELGGILYYLSGIGFCAYSGGEPYKVSLPLADTVYTKAAAGTDGQRYYAAAYQSDGTCDVLVYDPAYRVWYREDDTPFLGFVSYDGRLYGGTANGVWSFGNGKEAVAWSFTTQRMTYDAMEHKGPNSLWIRLEAEEETAVTVEISHDGGDFITVANLPPRSGFGVRRIPIRFQLCDSAQLRISGTGRAVIHDLELMTYQGGKTYGI